MKVTIKSIDSLDKFFDLLNGNDNERCSGPRGRYNFKEGNSIYSLINLRKHFGDVSTVDIQILDQTRFIEDHVESKVLLKIEEIDSLTFKFVQI